MFELDSNQRGDVTSRECPEGSYTSFTENKYICVIDKIVFHEL